MLKNQQRSTSKYWSQRILDSEHFDNTFPTQVLATLNLSSLSASQYFNALISTLSDLMEPPRLCLKTAYLKMKVLYVMHWKLAKLSMLPWLTASYRMVHMFWSWTNFLKKTCFPYGDFHFPRAWSTSYPIRLQTWKDVAYWFVRTIGRVEVNYWNITNCREANVTTATEVGDLLVDGIVQKIVSVRGPPLTYQTSISLSSKQD